MLEDSIMLSTLKTITELFFSDELTMSIIDFHEYCILFMLYVASCSLFFQQLVFTNSSLLTWFCCYLFWILLYIRYFRHASGEILVISRALAQFISINRWAHVIYYLQCSNPKGFWFDHCLVPCNRAILYTYAHDDVSVGSWFIGLDVKHIHEGKLCCSSWSSGISCIPLIFLHSFTDDCIVTLQNVCSGFVFGIVPLGTQLSYHCMW